MVVDAYNCLSNIHVVYIHRLSNTHVVYIHGLSSTHVINIHGLSYSHVVNIHGLSSIQLVYSLANTQITNKINLMYSYHTWFIQCTFNIHGLTNALLKCMVYLIHR